MDSVMTFLSVQIGDPRVAAWVFVLMAATLAFAIGGAAVALLGGLLDPVRGRARALLRAERPAGREWWTRLSQRLAPHVLPKAGGRRDRTRARLIHAGYRSEDALSNYYAIKTLLAFGLPLLVLVLLGTAHLSGKNAALAAAWSVLVGVIAPERWLKWAVVRRKRILYASMPDALDLLVVCTEAGYGLKQAIQRVAEELKESHPELAAELGLVNAEIRAGVDRVEALRHLAERTDLEDIGGLVSLMAQSLRFGTSVADSLRIYADEFRDKRTQRAEEVAATVATRMVFPLVTCMFPAFFLVAIGPAVIGVVHAFGTM